LTQYWSSQIDRERPVPASGGEKVLAGANDHEISIVFPASRLYDLLSGFKGTQRMPHYLTVYSTLVNEPSVPEDYLIACKELTRADLRY
jgi:hypothetical protein